MASDPVPTASENDEYELDPVFVNSRREAWFIFGLWFVCLIWAVPVSYSLGFGQPATPEDMPLVLGIPRWTFWGVLLPWLVADAVTLWFCFRYLKDDPLDAVAGEEAAEETSADSDGGNA